MEMLAIQSCYICVEDTLGIKLSFLQGPGPQVWRPLLEGEHVRRKVDDEGTKAESKRLLIFLFTSVYLRSSSARYCPTTSRLNDWAPPCEDCNTITILHFNHQPSIADAQRWDK